jgi:hypothetical protein
MFRMFRVSVICRVVSESASDFDLRLRELDRLDEETAIAVEDRNGTPLAAPFLS